MVGLWWTIGMFADIGQMLLMPLLHWTILPVGEVSMATSRDSLRVVARLRRRYLAALSENCIADYQLATTSLCNENPSRIWR
ncbi:hypothetical protein IG631_09551 [Alternaria alternata]|nr:hypothetical protein IG631_09551 [Alternaria alternata]